VHLIMGERRIDDKPKPGSGSGCGVSCIGLICRGIVVIGVRFGFSFMDVRTLSVVFAECKTLSILDCGCGPETRIEDSNVNKGYQTMESTGMIIRTDPLKSKEHKLCCIYDAGGL
jgi:hypothetical protein